MRPSRKAESKGAAAIAQFERDIEPARARRTGEHPVLAHLEELEAKLTGAGWPAMSPWWRAQFRRFYGSARRRFVGRVGRRGGKSTSLCRIAILEALHGEHTIPPGDVGYVVLISHKRQEANERIATIRKALDVLGVPWEPIEDGIRLAGRNVAFRVYVATIAGVSGPTAIALIFDEVAKWRDAKTGANPATEVLNSARPMAATMPNAREFLVSSPLGTLDAHAAAVSDGDTPHQLVAEAPTWKTNPTLSEEATRALEPDERIWKREYGAEPMEGNEESIFLPAVLDAITRAGDGDVPAEHGWSYVAAMDPATRGNAWTLVVMTRDPRARRIVVLRRQWQGSPSKPLDPEELFPAIGSLLAPYAVTRLLSDQWAGDALASIARRHKLTLDLRTSDMMPLYNDAAVLARDGMAEIPKDPLLRADLLGVFRRVTPNGIRLDLRKTPDGRHCDYAPPWARLMLEHCAVPRHLPRTDAERVEAAALKDDLRRYGGGESYLGRARRLPR